MYAFSTNIFLLVLQCRISALSIGGYRNISEYHLVTSFFPDSDRDVVPPGLPALRFIPHSVLPNAFHSISKRSTSTQNQPVSEKKEFYTQQSNDNNNLDEENVRSYVQNIALPVSALANMDLTLIDTRSARLALGYLYNFVASLAQQALISFQPSNRRILFSTALRDALKNSCLGKVKVLKALSFPRLGIKLSASGSTQVAGSKGGKGTSNEKFNKKGSPSSKKKNELPENSVEGDDDRSSELVSEDFQSLSANLNAPTDFQMKSQARDVPKKKQSSKKQGGVPKKPVKASKKPVNYRNQKKRQAFKKPLKITTVPPEWNVRSRRSRNKPSSSRNMSRITKINEKYVSKISESLDKIEDLLENLKTRDVQHGSQEWLRILNKLSRIVLEAEEGSKTLLGPLNSLYRRSLIRSDITKSLEKLCDANIDLFHAILNPTLPNFYIGFNKKMNLNV